MLFSRISLNFSGCNECANKQRESVLTDLRETNVIPFSFHLLYTCTFFFLVQLTSAYSTTAGTLGKAALRKDSENLKVLERQGRIFLALDDLDAAHSIVTTLEFVGREEI